MNVLSTAADSDESEAFMHSMQTMSLEEPAQPASRWAVLGTGAILLIALVAAQPLISPDGVWQQALVTGWIPALWTARLLWAAHRGAIRQRIVRRDVAVEIDGQRWGLALANPPILTRRGQPFRFRVYFAMEFVLC